MESLSINLASTQIKCFWVLFTWLSFSDTLSNQVSYIAVVSSQPDTVLSIAPTPVFKSLKTN